tara:strand:- start:640 stop:2355 length:1716 start_codon:yes stop_codon:yes gene_type:complete
MALNKIKTASITDDAVNADKLAAGSVTSSELNKTALTGQPELSETANDGDFTLIFDTSSSTLKKVLRSNLKQAAPVFTSVSPTSVDTSSGSTTTLTITGSGFTAGSNARLINNSGKVVEFTTVTRNSATQITAVVTHTSVNDYDTPYDIQLTNGEGLSTVAANQLDINASPIWITSAGSLGTNEEGETVSYTVQAYDPDSTSVVSYELQSGSLPAGLSLSSSSGDKGIISGTLSAVGADTTSNFVIRATDSASNTVSRSFSITVTNKLFQIFTSSGTFSVPTGVSSVDVLVVAGGGRGSGGGGGAGGLIYRPGFTVTPGGTLSVTVGQGGLKGPLQGCVGGVGANGQNSVFGTLTAIGGGAAGSGYTEVGPSNPNFGKPGFSPHPAPAVARMNGGSGGGGGYGAFNISACGINAGQGTQPTQSGESGAYGFGNPGAPGANPGAYGGESNVPVQMGGGGGAGAAGNTGSGQTTGGQGGIGKAYTIADNSTPVYYAGGGGGGAFNGVTSSGGQGGQGGGGQGGFSGSPGTPTTVVAQAATANKGGGGGGGNIPCGIADGTERGGKGIVIVRWT